MDEEVQNAAAATTPKAVRMMMTSSSAGGERASSMFSSPAPSSEHTPSTSNRSMSARKEPAEDDEEHGDIDQVDTKDDQMQVDDREENVEVSSDIEVLAVISTTGKAKRKTEDADSESVSFKKIKTTAAPGARAAAARTKKEPIVKALVEKKEPGVVELKGGKFVLKQKVLSWAQTASDIEGLAAFAEVFNTFVNKNSKPKIKFTEWPVEHYGVVARSVHESDKTSSQAAKEVRAALVDYLHLTNDESQGDSQEDIKLKTSRMCMASLTSLVEEIADRVNYGISLEDLPNGLPEGVDEIPARLQLFRWELKDASLFPSQLAAKLTRRIADRVAAKELAVELFLALSAQEQEDLLKDGKKSKAIAISKPTTQASTVASGSGTQAMKRISPKKVVDSEAEEAEREAKSAKAKEKEEKEREKEEKKALRDAERLEREEKRKLKDDEIAAKKAKKAEEDAAKQAEIDKKEAIVKKQASAFGGFFKKAASTSPAPADLSNRRSATPGSKETDFDRVFKPFHVKHDTELSAIRRLTANFEAVPDAPSSGRELGTLLQSGVPLHLIPPRKERYPVALISVREVVQSITEREATGLDTAELYAALENRQKLPIKLLKFREDSVRPGYIGTWSKTSKAVGFRKPFGKDTALLQYDYDSEYEWEEEDPLNTAEDVNSNGERSEEDEEDSDAELSDGWLCEDDEVTFVEGYNGDDAPMEGDDDNDDEEDAEMKATRRKIAEREKKHRSGKEAQKKKKTLGVLLPIIKGPVWEDKIGSIAHLPFQTMRCQFVNDAYVGLNPLTFQSTVVDRFAIVASATTTLAAVVAKSKSKPVKRASKVAGGPLTDDAAPSDDSTTSIAPHTLAADGSFIPAKPSVPKPVPKSLPEHHLAEFVQLCIANADMNKPDLVTLVHLEMRKKEHNDSKLISKAAVAQSMKELGMSKDKTPGSKWYFDAGVLEKYT